MKFSCLLAFKGEFCFVLCLNCAQKYLVETGAAPRADSWGSSPIPDCRLAVPSQFHPELVLGSGRVARANGSTIANNLYGMIPFLAEEKN